MINNKYFFDLMKFNFSFCPTNLRNDDDGRYDARNRPLLG